MSAPQREKIELNPNEPVTLTLKYGTGKMMPDNGFGPSVMYSTVDNRVLFLDLATSQKVNNLGVQPGESITICKQCRKGQPREYVVSLSVGTERGRAWKESEGHAGTPPAPPSDLEAQMQGTLDNIREGKPPAAPRPQPMPPAIARKLDSHPQEQLGTGTNGPVAMPARPAAQQPVAFLTALTADTNALVDVYAACLQHASQHGVVVKPEDVRSLLQTVYINRTKGASYAA